MRALLLLMSLRRRRVRAGVAAFRAAYRAWRWADESPRYSPKMIIETLCLAQSRVAASPLDRHRVEGDLDRLGHLIRQYEQRQRVRRP